jgi:thiamine-phosphate pyrophosphorylase
MESPRPNKQGQGQRPAPRLTLITPLLDDAAAFTRALASVLSVADVAAVLLRLAPADERTQINRIKTLAPTVQQSDIALLLDGHPDLVARSGADGAHLTGIAALNEAIGVLQPARIAGVGGLQTRHDAMLAGEAGADYVMFGEPDIAGRRPSFAAIVERVAWWAEVFQPPCVGFAGSLDEVAALAAVGADFVALGDWVWTAASGPEAAIAAAQAQLVVPERVG